VKNKVAADWGKIRCAQRGKGKERMVTSQTKSRRLEGNLPETGRILLSRYPLIRENILRRESKEQLMREEKKIPFHARKKRTATSTGEETIAEEDVPSDRGEFPE